jgi:hypothetical protein
VRRDPALDEAPSDRALRWTRDQDRFEVVTQSARVQMTRLDARSFAATATIGSFASSASSLTTAISTAVTFAQGGLVLHATGVRIAGGSLLFIGPSGAGKTTTANQLVDATWIARDRAAVTPAQGGWLASGLAGGDELRLAQSEPGSVPLAGVLRVVRAEGRSRLEPLRPADAIHVLRESIQAFPSSADDEAELLERALALTTSVSVARLHVALGDPLEPILERIVRETTGG